MTCPTTRIHPAIIAQAAATAGLLTEGRFNLGVGTGEALNEHVTGQPWPAGRGAQGDARGGRRASSPSCSPAARSPTTVGITRWKRHGCTPGPAKPPPIYVSGFGEQSAELAARIADGYICIGPEADLVKRFRDQGGGSKPVQGGLKGCWAPDAAQARATLRQLWPSDFIPGESAQLLPTPRHFSQLAPLVTDDLVTAPAGPDPKPYLETLSSFEQAGFDEVYLQQVGGNLEGAFEFFATERAAAGARELKGHRRLLASRDLARSARPIAAALGLSALGWLEVSSR